MKKTIKILVEKMNKLQESNGSLQGGFASVKGGFSSYLSTNTHGCSNSIDCTQSTNLNQGCSNTGTCFS